MLVHPILGLTLLVTIFPFLVGVDPGVGVTEQLFAGLFIAWLFGWVGYILVSKRTLQLNYPSYLISSALALTALLVFSVINSFLRNVPMVNIIRDLSQFIGYFIVLPAAMLVRDERIAKKVLRIMFILGSICYPWNTAFWISKKYGMNWPDWPTLSVGAAYLGPFLAALWPLTLLQTRRRYRILAILGIFTLLILSIVSGYRWRIVWFLALTGITLLITFFVYRQRRVQTLVAGSLLLLVSGVLIYGGLTEVSPLVPGRIQRIYNTLLNPSLLRTDLSVQGRLVEAKAALSIFLQSPLIGVGLGQHVPMEWAHGRWYKTSFSQHIWVTEMLMKFGMLGSIIFLWYFLAAVRFTLKCARRIENDLYKALALGATVWIIISLIPAIGHFGDRGFNFTLALMLAAVAALTKGGAHSLGEARR